MTSPNHINFNALIPKFDKRTCEIGDQTFDISNVPMGVGVVFLRSQTDSMYTTADATIDATLIMLNQKRDANNWISRSWLEERIPGSALIKVTNHVLHPFWNPPQKEGAETSLQKKD